MNRRKRPRGERGSVSVYFMVVLSALLLFQLTLLDLARLHAAKHRAQRAADAALRSVYAGFDPALQKYGLYGTEVGAASEQTFRRVLTRNLQSPGIRTARGSWIDLEADAAEGVLRHYDRLSDPDVFRHQILEEMKIRAPIEYVLLVIERWRDTDALEDTRQAASLGRRLEQIEALLEQRNDRLERAGVLIAALAGDRGLAADRHADNRQVHEQLGRLAEEIRDRTAEVLEEELARLEAKLNELMDRLRDLEEKKTPDGGERDGGKSPGAKAEPPDSIVEPDPTEAERRRLEDRIEETEKEIRAIHRWLDAIAAYTGLVFQHDRALQERETELQEAAERIASLFEEARALNRQAAEEAGRLDAAFGGAVRLHDDAEYDVWLSGIGELTARFAAYSVQFDPAALMTGRDFQQRRDRLDRMNDAFRDQAAALHGAYGAWLTQLRAVEADLARRRDEERDQAEHSIAQALNLAAACPDGGESAYAALAERYGRYLAGTPEGAAGGDSGEENGGEPIRNRKVDAVAGDAFTLAERLQTALLTVRDRAYVIEYALTKFNYRTMGDAGGELSDPAGHVLPRQEAEYILYGWNSCAMNHGSAFAEMFLLRLAIRTAERLLAPDQAIASLGSPWLVFLRAVAEGAALALRDMRRLASGERVEISARLPQALTMDYKDYLRLFMVLHGDQTRMLARMQALVDLNTGVDLAERAALSEAEVEVLFRPWMLPAVPGRLGADARNGRLVIRVRAAQAY